MSKELKTYFITGNCRSQNNIMVNCNKLIKANNVFIAEKQFENTAIVEGFYDPFVQDIKVIE